MADTEKTKQSDAHAEPAESEWVAAFRSVKENPLMYAGAVIFILAVAAFSWYYRVQTRMDNEANVSALASAIDEEELSVQLTLFEALAEEETHVQPEALYMLGETALKLEQYDLAIKAFSQLRDEFSDFYLAPDGVEGLGFAYEAQEKYAEAEKEYKYIQSTWPDSFASLRQPFNVGRTLLAAGDTQGAIAAFREQQNVFAGSRAGANAQLELAELRAKSPELFEEEESVVNLGDEELPITLDISPAEIVLDPNN